MLYIGLGSAASPANASAIAALPFGEADCTHLLSLRHDEARAHAVGARRVLCQLLRIGSPHDISFSIVTDPHGRPFLRDNPLLDFNLSHAKGLCVAALCCGNAPRVGIDLEHCAHKTNIEKLANRFFAPEERQAVDREGAEAFFRIWTQKEAYAKYLGVGLSSVLQICDTKESAAAAGLRLSSFPVRYGGESYYLSYCVRAEEAPPQIILYEENIFL